VCVLCSHNCGLRVDVDDGKIVAVRGDASNPATRGYLCNKAYGLAHYVNHAQRVEHPLKRRPDGSFERVGWDEAIADIGARLRRLREEHGPTSIGMVGVGGQGNHLDGTYAIGFLLGLGSPWWFNSLAQEKTQHALVDDWMFGAPPSVFLHADAERSKFLLVLGTNPLVSNRGRNPSELWRELRADASRTLVIVDPRRTQSAKSAAEHVQVRPGTDVYVLIGLAAHIVRAELEDKTFLRARTRGLDELRARLAAVDPAEMAARAGVPAEQLVRVAEGFARAESASVWCDLGVEQVPFSTLNSYLMRVLLALTGNLGNRGGNVFHGTFSPSIGRADRRPFRAPASGIEAIAMLAPFGMFSPSLIPEEVLTPRPDRIRALIVEGANPLVQAADSPRQREAMAALDLLVVIDPAMTETARAAHYVLPTPVGYEKWEYSGFPKSYPEIHAQLRPPVVPAPAGPEAPLPEAEIYARLARAAGVVEPTPRALGALGARAGSPLGAAAYLAAAGAAAAARGRSLGGTVARMSFWSYEALAPILPAPALSGLWLQTHFFALTRREEVARSLPAASATRNPFVAANALWQALLDHPEGVEVARLDPDRNLAEHCRRPDGKIDLAPRPMMTELARAIALVPAPDRDYPLLLNGGARTHWNANTIQRDPAWRKGQGPHCAVAISPDDAARFGVADGALVEVASRRGAVRLPAKVDDSVQPGNLLIPNGFGTEWPDAKTGELRAVGVRVNELTDAADRDPFTGCPHHKVVRCRVRPLQG
jgi:anaerobic selenocysteine-containing dehydrogenase